MEETFKIRLTPHQVKSSIFSFFFFFYAVLFILQLCRGSRNWKLHHLGQMHTTADLLKNNLFSFLCLDARGKKPIISAPLPPEIESRYFEF